jgi:hypothetical protein
LWLPAGERATQQLAHVSPLLHRDLRDARERMAVLVETRRVADDKDLGMIRHGKFRLHAHASRTIGFHAQPLSRGRRRHAGRPDDRLRRLGHEFPRRTLRGRRRLVQERRDGQRGRNPDLSRAIAD